MQGGGWDGERRAVAGATKKSRRWNPGVAQPPRNQAAGQGRLSVSPVRSSSKFRADFSEGRGKHSGASRERQRPEDAPKAEAGPSGGLFEERGRDSLPP